jgi:hypothetical protein
MALSNPSLLADEYGVYEREALDIPSHQQENQTLGSTAPKTADRLFRI